jgi:bile acid:Na+ symporter, BASS family
MGEFLATLQNLFTFAFVVSSMLAMGLSLTVGQILQPLSNRRLVALALVANFVIVPGTAYLLAQVIPMDEPLQIGLILMGAAAGAPFLPKLAQIARANVAFAVGLMALLVVVTVAYLPLVLMLGLNIENVIGLFGSGALLAILILVAVAIGSGYLLGGPGRDTRQVLAIGTGQRNLAATFLIAGSNFSDQPDVLVFLAGAGLIGMALVMPLAAEFGKRAESTTATPAGATSSTGEHAAGP